MSKTRHKNRIQYSLILYTSVMKLAQSVFFIFGILLFVSAM